MDDDGGAWEVWVRRIAWMLLLTTTAALCIALVIWGWGKVL